MQTGCFCVGAGLLFLWAGKTLSTFVKPPCTEETEVTQVHPRLVTKHTPGNLTGQTQSYLQHSCSAPTVTPRDVGSIN